jgi:hypothetical protein
MKKWKVEITVIDTIEVEAVTQEDAELRALEMFDPTANEPSVYDSWEVEGEEMLEAMIADHEEREHAAELENFDPITVLEKQEQTGELK